MRKLFTILILITLLCGCKKDNVNLNNGTVTLQLQGSSTQTFAMNEMRSSYIFPSADSLFCNGCTLPGTNYYPIILDYNSTGSNDHNVDFMADLKLWGIFPYTWKDTPVVYYFYQLLSEDSLLYQDTSQYLAITTTDHVTLGADLKYTDANSIV